MDDRTIKEMLELLGYGDTPPEGLMRTIVEFRRRKSVIRPTPITDSDVVMATMMYDMLSKKPKKDEKNG